MTLTAIAFRFITSIWRLFPAKKSLSKIIKKQTYFREKLYKDLRYKGIFKVKFKDRLFLLSNPGFTTIENEIFWKGVEEGWEKISIDVWSEMSKNASVILDIGANTGIYSLISSAMNPNSEIYAFEPVERANAILRENLKINNFNNIHLLQKAVSNKTGKSTFYDANTESQYRASLCESMLADNPDKFSYQVEVVAIDEMNEFKNKKIDLIKLDVEMHEPEALKGMIKIIKRDRPALIIEILTDEIAEKVQKLFADLDYLYFSIDEVKAPYRVGNLEKSAYHNFLICSKETATELNLNCKLELT